MSLKGPKWYKQKKKKPKPVAYDTIEGLGLFILKFFIFFTAKKVKGLILTLELPGFVIYLKQPTGSDFHNEVQPDL